MKNNSTKNELIEQLLKNCGGDEFAFNLILPWYLKILELEQRLKTLESLLQGK